MTAAQLRTALAAMLSGELGTYKLPTGATTAAIYVGEPPSDWVASGLEARIAIVPELDQSPAYNRGIITETHQVRLVSHGVPSKQLTALRRVLSRWPRAQATEVPANEALGILAQHTITIPA